MHDLNRFEVLFEDNNIDLTVLSRLTDEDLQSLGLSIGVLNV